MRHLVLTDVEFLPLTGSPAGLGDTAAAAARAAAVLEDTRALVQRVRSALDGQRGTAIASARQRLAEIALRAGDHAGVLAATASVLRGHAEDLSREQARALDAIARRAESLAAERRWLAIAEEDRWKASNPLDPLSQAVSVRLAHAHRECISARADVAAAEADWLRSRDAKYAASRRAAASLGVLGDARAVRMATAGHRDLAALLESWANGLRAAGLTEARPGSDRPELVASRAALRHALVQAGDDPAFWSAFWGATAPRELYAALGVEPLGNDLAAAVRTGIEQWSWDATPGELESFGRGVVEGLTSGGVGLSEQAAIAAALLPPTLPGIVHSAAGEALDQRRRTVRVTDTELTWTASVAVAVANGLFAHPEAAFDHLAPTDDGLLAARVHAWFGLAPPDGWPDGGEAVAGALLAAVAVGSRSPSRSDQSRVALLMSHVTQEAPGGLLKNVPPSDLASARIARAYEPYVPVFGDSAVGAEKDEKPEPGTQQIEQLADGWLESPEAVIQPDLDAFSLVRVISATSQTDVASGEWLAVGDRYRDTMLGLAFQADEPVESVDQHEIVEETLRNAGALAGSLQAETMLMARQQQDRQDAAVGGLSFLATAATKVLPAGAARTADGGVTVGGALLPPLLPDHLAAGKEAVLREAEGLRHRFADPAYARAVEFEIEENGTSRHDAPLERAALDPSSSGSCESFEHTFDLMSDLGRKLGDDSCNAS